MDAAANIPQCRGVIFDMDGTVVEPLLDFDAIRRELGIDTGEGILEAIAAMAPDRRDSAEHWLTAYELSAANRSRLMPGAARAVAAIRKADLRTALLTRNTAVAMQTVLARHPELRFDLTMTREDGPIKPEPDGIRRACGQLGIDPARTVCVGDFLYDIRAARAAGAVAVLLAPNAPPPFAAQAHHVIRSLDALIDLLRISPAT